jgi:plastocyanin
MRRLLVASAFLLLVSCSDNSPTDSGDGSQVSLLTTSFSPQLLTVSAGTEVTWVNTTSTTHTITPDQHTQWQRREMSNSGETFTVRFDTPGSYEYYCEPHQSVGMTGRITVTP